MTLDDLVRELEGFNKEALEKRVAEKAAEGLKIALSATLAAGKTPEGAAWAPKVKGSGAPYANAASHLEVKAHGNLIRAVIAGPDVYGHFGRGKSQVSRPMLPDGGAGVPPAVAKVLEEASDKVFAELTR